MYKLTSDLPLIWRTPTSIQVGLDFPRAVIPKLYPSEERFLSALRCGFGDVSLNTVAQECGLTSAERDAFLTALGPALAQSTSTPSLRIVLDGSGPFVDSLGLLLIGCGHKVVRASAATGGRCDLAIVVGEYVLEPHRPSGWLSRDIPHLPVVFSDESVRIGPLLGLTPGKTSVLTEFPCEQCVELSHRDTDDCWVAMVSQLVGTPAPSQTPQLIAEAASIVSRWISRPQSFPVTSHRALRILEKTGEKLELTYALHPDCACQALPRNVSVLGSSHGRFPAAPRTKTVASGLG